MYKTRLLKKSLTNDIVTDISKAFNLLSKKDKLYFITIEGISYPHIKDMNFELTNRLFNTIHKEYRNTFEFMNYLFIIEYGGVISKTKLFDTLIEDLGIHCHCLVNTSLTKIQLEYYINTSLKKVPNVDIQDISKSDTKEYLLNYFTKQNKSGLMTRDSYNYKITETSTKQRTQH